MLELLPEITILINNGIGIIFSRLPKFLFTEKFVTKHVHIASQFLHYMCLSRSGLGLTYLRASDLKLKVADSDLGNCLPDVKIFLTYCNRQFQMHLYNRYTSTFYHLNFFDQGRSFSRSPGIYLWPYYYTISLLTLFF